MKRFVPILLCTMLGTMLCAAQAHAAKTLFANTYRASAESADNTAAIQRALDAAAKLGHGATVQLQPGTYRTGALFVKSNTELHLAAGVTLQGLETLAAYPMMPTRVAGIEMTWPAALVNVYAQHNVRVTGPGTIDGNGKVWWDRYWALRHEYEKRGLRWAADYDTPRPRLVQVFRAKHVELSRLTLLRSGFWTVHICYSDQVVADGLTIRNNIGGKGPSTDGIDVDSSDHVLVQHADISVNDDALCLKSGRDSDGLRVNRPDRFIVIRDSIVREGAAAITIGSETSGGFSHIDVYGIHALAGVPSGVLIKSARTRGGWAKYVRFHDLQLDGVATPIHITMDWNPAYSYATLPAGLAQVPAYYRVLTAPVPLAQGLAHFRDVAIWNVHATGAKRAFDVSANPAAPLQNFSLSHIWIAAQTAGSVADTTHWMWNDVHVDVANGSQIAFHNATRMKTEGAR